MVTNVKPSPTELTLLKALWRESPLSAREVHERVSKELDWSYSSTRKTLDRMQGKGYLDVQDFHGIRVYMSKISKVRTLATYIKDLACRVLEVDGPLPVSMFADSRLLNKDEQKELEELLLMTKESEKQAKQVEVKNG